MVDGPYRRLKDILRAALQVPSGSRKTFLDGACLGDAELRSQAGAVLASLSDLPDPEGARDLDDAIRKTLGGYPPTLATTPPPALPDHIGRYPIRGKLGEGGMGIVYRAHDPMLDREIAIKTLPPSFAEDRERVARFRREARMLATVNHPGITTIYSIEEADEDLFLTMEYVPGETLAERVTGNVLDVEETLRVARQIAGALEASHKRGVIHRDLKPPNVKITPDDEVKLLDFGLARPVSTTPDITNIGEAVGTPGYMSPEQLRGHECDQRTDVWAFGCLLSSCLTGRSPFAGRSAAETVAATLTRDPDLGSLPPETPPPLRDLIFSCLTRSVESRPSHMGEIRRVVDALIAEHQTESDVTERDASQTPNNLSRRLTSIVGRDVQLSEVNACLGEHRLVTLTGAGGSGKTRLALEVAWDQLPAFPAGAWFVELAGLRDVDLIPAAVLTALGLREAPGRSPMTVLIDHARDRRLLMVLDNCEHVIEGVRTLVGRLLQACPATHIVASSREELAIHGERVFSVPPLSVPDDPGAASADIEANPSVQLFLQRARLVRPSLKLTEANAPVVAEICRRLDGLPLAIELAAARTRVISIDELARRLEQRLQILSGKRTTDVAHHQTLRGLIAWSYELLEEKEQAVFRRLAIFSGGWTLEAAETVCEGDDIDGWEVLDLLTRLLEKSLVERDREEHPGADGTRFRMLETVREYAAERLAEADETAESGRRHRDHYLAEAEKAAARIKGPEESMWLARLGADHDNLGQAMDACQGPGGGELGLRFIAALNYYWAVRSQLEEAHGRCTRALAHPDAQQRTELRARALNGAGILAERRGDYEAARDHCEESLAISRELTDHESIALTLNSLAIVEANQGHNTDARRLYEESLAAFRKLDDRSGVGRVLNNLGTVAKNEGDFAAARQYLDESLSIREELGDRSGVATSLANLALMAAELEDHAAARDHAEASLAIYRELGDRRGIATMLVVQGAAAANAHDYDAARRYYGESLVLRQESGDLRGVGYSLLALGTAADGQGDHEQACSYAEESLEVFRDLGHPFGVAESLRLLGMMLTLVGDLRTAARLLGATEAVYSAIHCEISPTARDQIDQAADRARTAIGQEALQKEWDLGAAMSMEDAIALALNRPARESD